MVGAGHGAAAVAGRSALSRNGRALLDGGANPKSPLLGTIRRPLDAVVSAGRPEIIALLLARGARPDALQRHGWTALTRAAGDNFLLSPAGADPRRVDRVGRNAVAHALEGDRYDRWSAGEGEERHARADRVVLELLRDPARERGGSAEPTRPD